MTQRGTLQPGADYLINVPSGEPRIMTYVGPGGRSKIIVRTPDGESEVPAGRLLCPAQDAEEYLAMQRQLTELYASWDLDRTQERALQAVSLATGEDADVWTYDRCWVLATPDVAKRIYWRADLGDAPEPGAREDGKLVYNGREGLRWAQAFAAANPDLIQLFLEREEDSPNLGMDEFERAGTAALLRQWAGLSRA